MTLDFAARRPRTNALNSSRIKCARFQSIVRKILPPAPTISVGCENFRVDVRVVETARLFVCLPDRKLSSLFPNSSETAPGNVNGEASIENRSGGKKRISTSVTVIPEKSGPMIRMFDALPGFKAGTALQTSQMSALFLQLLIRKLYALVDGRRG